METIVHSTKLELVMGNLVTEETEAIVNPAQKSLHPGGALDGQIHLWGGEKIWLQCRALGGCETGDAKITTAGDLQAKYVIHTVGPIWSGGKAGEPELLKSCYKRCLQVAAENCVKSIAFPAISTGDYSYPMEEAAPIAVRTVFQYLQLHNEFELVRFVLKGRKSFGLHCAALENLLTGN